jgi:hypothetical protein
VAYTPELSLQSSRTLRRIAWALDLPMTQTLERVFDHLPRILDPEKVYEACRDKSLCHECLFSTHHKEEANL